MCDKQEKNTNNKNTFLSETELASLGLKAYGNNVLISRNCIIYSPDKVEIGDNVRIDDFATLSGKIKIGNYVHIAQFAGMYGGDEGIFMDDFTGLSSKGTIYATSNDYSGEYMTNPTVPRELSGEGINKAVRIKKHVVIGSGSVVLPGVTIETGVAVGAMSLCNKDLEEWGIYAGIPAKLIKKRKKDLLEKEKRLYKNHNE